MRRQIEGNDPELNTLYIDKYNYLPPDGDWERDGKSIGRNDHIRELRFGEYEGINMGEDDFVAFYAGLSRNRSIQKLGLMFCSISDADAVTLAPSLGGNGALTELNLSFNWNVTSVGWSAIFTQLQSPQSSLDNLDLMGNYIDDAAANLLGDFVANNTHLNRLDLSEIGSITNEGWRSVFDALRSPHCMLQELQLHSNSLNDEDIAYLASTLSANCILSSLILSGNFEVTASGWRAFSVVLQNPHSSLEIIDLVYNSVDDNLLVSLAPSLVHNNKLKELLIVADDWEEPITKWDSLSSTLCNQSSIDATFNSNHTLQRVVCPRTSASAYEVNESQLSSDLGTFFQLNRENAPTEAARRKIIMVHFSRNFNMQPFINMNLKVLPQAIAWMARDEYGSSLLYRFVRDTTFFVGLGGANDKDPTKSSEDMERGIARCQEDIAELRVQFDKLELQVNQIFTLLNEMRAKRIGRRNKSM